MPTLPKRIAAGFHRAMLPWLLVLTCLALLTATNAQAQRFGRRFIEQNTPPATEFIAARWHFGTNGAIGHMGWSHNYPESDRNFNNFIRRATDIDVEVESYRIVELGSAEVFEYPFAYISEPGEMALTDAEVENLREFIARGGFVLVDDFDGPWQLATFRSEIRRTFPGRDLIRLDPSHPVFNTFFPLESLQGMSPYVPGGEINYLALLNDDGSVAILAGHNNDLANFWEWYDQPQMPLKPSTDAFRLGTNSAIYSLTH
ncbi:MAG: DUF4159 domain-containing protein [Gammaproteobacteria bacterium]|nr:DUF4159 domain-containing protein [Gammaproteobacteria bacterium]